MNQPPLDVSRSVGGNSGTLTVAPPLTLPSYLAGEDGASLVAHPSLLTWLCCSRPCGQFPLSNAALCTPSVSGYHGVVYRFRLNCLPLLSGKNWARGSGGYIACRHDGISPSPEGDSFDLQALFFRRFSMCCGQFFMLILLYIVRAFV